MSKLINLCLKAELTKPVSVHSVIAGCGGPFWNETKDNQGKLAEKIDKQGIPFALVEDGNLLTIYVSKENYNHAKKAMV